MKILNLKVMLIFGFLSLFTACDNSEVDFPDSNDNCEINFPDKNLEALIREAIGKPSGCILASELESLTTLNAKAKSISEISGLEYCVNLTELDLTQNKISDISALARLVNLTKLNLFDNNISDISAVAGLVNLTELFLSMNPLSTTSCTVHIPELESRGVDVSYSFN